MEIHNLTTLMLLLSFEISKSTNCKRSCQVSESSMTCKFTFTVEWYSSQSRACLNCSANLDDCLRKNCILASGTQRAVLTANRQLPGPAIEVCLGDRIQVTVINELQDGETTSIHWHGMTQKETPFMDGVPMVTQCPILPGSSFLYDFTANTPGTYFWHSHSGFQRADGLAGSIIVRDPVDPHGSLYDDDSLDPVIISDWYPNESASFRFFTHHFGSGDDEPAQILINSRWQNSTESTDHVTSAFEYKINYLWRYRFRVISNTFRTCPISVTIDGHNLLVIATDGMNIEPIATRSLLVSSGERFDFVPYFSGEYKSGDGVYWLRATGLLYCSKNRVQGVAKICYDNGNHPKVLSSLLASGNKCPQVVDEVNSIQSSPFSKVTAGQFNNLHANANISKNPDASFSISTSFEKYNSPIYLPRLNGITNQMPPAPVLTQPGDVPSSLFCNSTQRKCPVITFCKCIHALNVAQNALVELVIVDTGNGISSTTRPFHLHGYSFYVVAMGILWPNCSVENVTSALSNGKIRRKFQTPVQKDTVAIPAGGYAVLRFVADNPGVWTFDSNSFFDKELGMTLILRVGNHTVPKNVPSNFTQCGISMRSFSTPAPNPLKSCRHSDVKSSLKILTSLFIVISSEFVREILGF